MTSFGKRHFPPAFTERLTTRGHVKPPSKIKTRLTNQGYHITVMSIGAAKLNEIKTDLTMIPYKANATKQENEKGKFILFKYSKNRLEIIVPRYYGICKFGKPDEEEFDSEEVDLSFTKTLRDIQITVCDKCINYIKKNGGGLLSVPCGFGKTVCAIYIAYKLGMKTLVVVHKSFLIKQWIKEIVDFLGIDTSRIGIIRQKKCEIIGKDIVIGMIQTISRHTYADGVMDNFGLVIYDEAHHIACKFFSKTPMKIGSQYTLALTATPYRGDRMIKVMYWFVGGTMYRERLKVNKNVVTKVIKYKSTDPSFCLQTRWFQGSHRPDTGKMVTNLCLIDTRNQALIDVITHIRRNEPERKMLILSSRKAHLDILKRGVDDLIREDIDAGIIDEDEVHTYYYIGPTKPADRQEAEERGDIIFATYGMADEGLNIKQLNTVILASPKKDVMQSVGRIMRTILKSGDIRPMIIDISDDMPAIKSWFTTRNSIYRSCKYEIENYYLVDDVFKTALKYSNLDIEGDPAIAKSAVELHHRNAYIHSMTNKHNLIHNKWKRDIEKFEDICQKIDIGLSKNPDIVHDADNELYKIKTSLTDQNYRILENVTFTELRDILFVPKLQEGDFDKIVIKDINENDTINLDKDMEFDILEAQKEMCVVQAISKHNAGIPKKKLFR